MKTIITREQIGDNALEVRTDRDGQCYRFYINGHEYDFHYNEVEVELFLDHVRKLLEIMESYK